jgi:multidrug transporter EmrE-like cation transporter
MNTIPIILLGVLLNAAAQLFLKAGTSKVGPIALSLDNAWSLFWTLAFNPMIFLGLSCYVISVAAWIVALSRVDVSYAYPMLSIGYVVSAVAAYYLFGETLSPMRLGGIFVIILGVYMISRTAT